ncbi:hypothetical protein WAI453_006454 [Rhynchosporium graminicola]
MDSEACDALLIHYVDPLMEKQLMSATDQMNELFRDRHRHAITYNHYFTDNVQKVFNDRYEKRLLEVLRQKFPLEDYTGTRTGPKDLSAICSMISRTIPDMDTHASIELLDHLESFYKVAMKTFVDNVAIQVIEASIVDSLADVFNPLAVAQMDSELVLRIAAESKEHQTQREMLDRKLHILEEGLNTCKRHASRHILELTSEDPPTSLVHTLESRPHSMAGSYVSRVPSVEKDVEIDVASLARSESFVYEAPPPDSIAAEVDHHSPRMTKRGKGRRISIIW